MAFLGDLIFYWFSSMLKRFRGNSMRDLGRAGVGSVEYAGANRSLSQPRQIRRTLPLHFACGTATLTTVLGEAVDVIIQIGYKSI